MNYHEKYTLFLLTSYIQCVRCLPIMDRTPNHSNSLLVKCLGGSGLRFLVFCSADRPDKHGQMKSSETFHFLLSEGFTAVFNIFQ